LLGRIIIRGFGFAGIFAVSGPGKHDERCDGPAHRDGHIRIGENFG